MYSQSISRPGTRVHGSGMVRECHRLPRHLVRRPPHRPEGPCEKPAVQHVVAVRDTVLRWLLFPRDTWRTATIVSLPTLRPRDRRRARKRPQMRHVYRARLAGAAMASSHAGRRVCLQGTHDLESREGLCNHHRHGFGLHCMPCSFWHLDQHAATIKHCVRYGNSHHGRTCTDISSILEYNQSIMQLVPTERFQERNQGTPTERFNCTGQLK